MRYRLFILGVGILSVMACTVLAADRGGAASGQAAQQVWQGSSLQVKAGEILRQKTGANQDVLICRERVSMVAAGRSFVGDEAVVWIERLDPNSTPPKFSIHAYLKGHVQQETAAKVADIGLQQFEIKAQDAVVLKMTVGPEVYTTTDKWLEGNPRGHLLYREALAAFESVGIKEFSPTDAMVKEAPARKPSEPKIGSTVTVAPRTSKGLSLEQNKVDDVNVAVTAIGGLYATWLEDAVEGREPRRFEIEADSLVLWKRAAESDATGTGGADSLMQNEEVTALYVQGDVVFRMGQQVIRAAEFYYDLRRQTGLASDVTYRTFEVSRGVPIIIRAQRLRQTAIDHFEATNVSLSTSPFATPQLWAEAESIRIVDFTRTPEPAPEPAPKGRFDAQMEDVSVKYYDTPIFWWPSLHANGEAPDVPIKSVHVGSDSTYGTSVETRWYLSRLLGLEEPEGTDSSLMADYYGKRGPGGGVDISYERESYFGRFLGYGVEDHGEDRLSRTQKDVDVPDKTRGRVKFQHRQFLPDYWQVTAEVGYASDENFLQQFYCSEFNAGKEQETLLHFKRIEDNTGLSILTKARINDFQNQIEELPSVDYHWTGQSFWDDMFTFYSDSQVSNYRYRYSSNGSTGDPSNYFAFVTTRDEVDMPLAVGRFKVVPYVAGTFGYDDGTGFVSDLDRDSDASRYAIGIGEGGVRASAPSVWRIYDVQSSLLDLNGLRHVMTPSMSVAGFAYTDPAAEQRNVLNLELSQRWQTKRGPKGYERTVDWIEWNTQTVWVDHETDAHDTGPDQLLWNKPFIPLVNRTTEQIPPVGRQQIPPQDRRTTSIFGPRRNYMENTWTFRMTDTTAILGDANYDLNSGVFQQVDVGVSRLVWPDLSYYVGSRYLRRLYSGREVGSNAVTFAATYVLDPRYTLVFSQQYDFDYGAGIRSDLTLIRKYHQLNLAVTISSDESLDERRVTFSLWPQGVPELSLGMRRYAELGATETY